MSSLFSSLATELSQRCKGATPHVIALNSVAALDSLRSIGALPPAAPAAGAADAAPPPAGGATRALPPLHVFHSGGLASEVAELVVKAASAHTSSKLVSMEDFKRWAAETELTNADDALGDLFGCFVLETVENEQPAEGAGPCTRMLHRRTLEAGSLARLNFTVLGLGDSNLLLDRQTTSAKDCNHAAQRLDARLAELGATRFYARGEADDRTGNQEISPWVSGLSEALGKLARS